MKLIHYLICILAMTACANQKQEIEVRLSLVDHYLKAELINHTDEDYYIPHFGSFFSIIDENEIDLTPAYVDHLRWYNPNFDELFPIGKTPSEFSDSIYFWQNEEYEDEIFRTEKDIFLKLNPHVTEEEIIEEYQLQFEDFLNILYVAEKCDGVAIKAGQSLDIYEDIFGLIKTQARSNERLSIKFMRHNCFEYSIYDTVITNGYKIYTPLPSINAGYKLYDGEISCSDVIHLN